MTYSSTKTFGHELGLSACFRQWRASSHCRFLHGYALSVKLTFECDELDERNWCIDFGGLKYIKEWLQTMFDHTLLVAVDDPHLDEMCALAGLGLADVRVVDATGCEAFAELIFDRVDLWLKDNGHAPRVWLASVEVREHAGNSAIYYGDDNA